MCEFDRIEIRALYVFDQCDLEPIAVIDIGHHSRNRRKLREARSPPALLTADQLIAVAGFGHDHGLQHAVAGYRLRHLPEMFGIEGASRLVGIGLDGVERNVRRARFCDGRGRIRGRCAGDQRSDAAPECFVLITHRCSPSDAGPLEEAGDTVECDGRG